MAQENEPTTPVGQARPTSPSGAGPISTSQSLGDIFMNPVKVPTDQNLMTLYPYMEQCAMAMLNCPIRFSKDELEVRRYYVETCINALLRTQAAKSGHLDAFKPFVVDMDSYLARPKQGPDSAVEGNPSEPRERQQLNILPESGEENGSTKKIDTSDARVDENTSENEMEVHSATATCQDRITSAEMPALKGITQEPKVENQTESECRDGYMNSRLANSQDVNVKEEKSAGVVDTSEPTKNNQKCQEDTNPSAIQKRRYAIKAVLYEQDKQIAICAGKFNELVKRSTELLRKLTTRKARKCFKYEVTTSKNAENPFMKIHDGTLNSDISKNELKAMNTWYTEYAETFSNREHYLSQLMFHVARCKEMMESTSYKAHFDEAAFDWRTRLEPFILKEGDTDTVFFLDDAKLPPQKHKQNSVDDLRLNFKEAVLFHFFQVPPRIILQLSLARPELQKNETSIKSKKNRR